jgi:predicted MFS family arabinose efflux permease
MRAIALVTLIGGLATAAVVPLTAALIAADGWRNALAWLAGAEILCGLALVPLLPARGRRTRVAPGNSAVVARASLVPLGIAYAASALVFAVATVHLVPYLIAEGFDAMGAARIVAAAGVSSLLGRALLLRFGDVAVANGVLAAVLLAQALGLALIGLSTSDIALAAYVLLFGIGMGTITPLRAVLVGRMTSGSRYARSNGGLAGVASLSRAAGPVAGSMIAATAAGYRGLFLACAALLLLGAGALHLPPIVRVSTHET